IRDGTLMEIAIFSQLIYYVPTLILALIAYIVAMVSNLYKYTQIIVLKWSVLTEWYLNSRYFPNGT
ncbi:hypothetical protein WUBG_17015, partial [Wuchereria bancrofti]